MHNYYLYFLYVFWAQINLWFVDFSVVSVLTAVDSPRRPVTGTTSVSLFFIFYFKKLLVWFKCIIISFGHYSTIPIMFVYRNGF